jgi:hypothetical protein
MDLNMAFAKHWDNKNPSNFVKACDESRQLQEAEERRIDRLRQLARTEEQALEAIKVEFRYGKKK